MTPNLRSLVANAYRVRQGRTFSSFSSFSSSSAPNPIGEKGKKIKQLTIIGLMPLSDILTSTAAWFSTGYVIHFTWELATMFKMNYDSEKEVDRCEIEIERCLDELRRSHR